MRFVLALLLSVMMSFNAVTPLMEQLLGHNDAYEQCEGNETQKEKEKSNEKEIVLAAYLLPNGNDIISEDIFRKNTFPKNDDMLTEHYVNVPELPPKA